MNFYPNPRNKFAIAQRELNIVQRLDRIDRNLLNLKVSHSKVRVQVGMARVASENVIRHFAQLRADIHEFTADRQETSGN